MKYSDAKQIAVAALQYANTPGRDPQMQIGYMMSALQRIAGMENALSPWQVGPPRKEHAAVYAPHPYYPTA
jgi:hypothetical protein